MEEKFEKNFKQAAAFQKMWMDSMSGMTRVWSEYSPQNPPPDELKKVRNGVLRAVSQSWDDYMRSPEFLETMRDTMNNSIQWKKWTKENSSKFHAAMGSASKEDMQGVMVAVQHVERRVLDSLDEMRSKVAGMKSELEGIQEKGATDLEQYQQEVLDRLAKIEKTMMNGAKAEVKATPPKAAPAKPAKKPAAVKKTATTKKSGPKKSAPKKAAKKVAKPSSKKVKES